MIWYHWQQNAVLHSCISIDGILQVFEMKNCRLIFSYVFEVEIHFEKFGVSRQNYLPNYVITDNQHIGFSFYNIF